MVLPFDARMQAAIHCAYWFSCSKHQRAETQIQVQSAPLLGTDQDVSSQLYNTQNCQLLSEARGEVPHVLSGCQSPTLTPNRNWVF